MVPPLFPDTIGRAALRQSEYRENQGNHLRSKRRYFSNKGNHFGEVVQLSMANQYIHNSKLDAAEVEKIVWKLVTFTQYSDIYRELGRSPQALRPLLMRIERRAYVECSELFYWFLAKHPNKGMDQKYGYSVSVLDFASTLFALLPRDSYCERTEELATVSKTDVQAEIDCIFDCPQHVGGKQYIERYGRPRRIMPLLQAKGGRPNVSERAKRIGLKRNCGACRSKFKDHLFRRPSYFCWIQDYAARTGKPRQASAELFVYRLCNFLAMQEWHEASVRFVVARVSDQKKASKRLVLEGKRSEKEARIRVAKEFNLADDQVKNDLHWLNKEMVDLILECLAADPIRLDRRRNQE